MTNWLNQRRIAVKLAIAFGLGVAFTEKDVAKVHGLEPLMAEAHHAPLYTEFSEF